jgi:Flp pilus assembly protein TadD
MHSGAPVSPTGEMPELADSCPSESKGRPVGLNDRWTVLAVCIFLAVITWLVFGQTLGHDFINYDDNDYVYENPEVARGLTLKGIVWAFTQVHASNWHPLTWVSHMLDCQFYGLNPGGHHLTNVLLHTATAILLFLVLRRMTSLRPGRGVGATTTQAGVLWRSAFVAAVFAIHPLRVESVAWVAERKDVLSGLFCMLTIGAYVRYVEKSKVQNPKSKVYYGLTLLFFMLGLMCKPMLVMLPFVLLLLDYWPLGRVTGDKWQATGEKKGKPSTLNPQLSTLLLEKLPLFGLAAASGVVTIFAQTEAIQSFEQISLPLRVGNASISYVTYLVQMFWPSGLAFFYPFAARDVGVSRVVLSLVLLAGISTGVFVLRRRPYFLTGWLWYLIMLVPVIGIVQVGVQAHADRYTYLPQIGLYLLLTWAVADLCAGWRRRRVVLGGCATIILAALIFCARVQTAYWRNSELLSTHTLACTSDNYIAHDCLGNALLKKGSVDEAIVHFQRALQIKPDYVKAYNNLGNALFKKGNVDEAIAQFQKALQIKPEDAEIRNNLAVALAKAHGDYANTLVQMGRDDEAIVEFRKALELFPDFADARHDLAVILLHKGQVDEAIAQFREIWKQYPDEAMASFDLGNAYFQKGQMDEAVAFYQRALQIKPDDVSALNNLGMALLTKGMVDEAVVQFRGALALQPDFALARTNLHKALLQKEHP